MNNRTMPESQDRDREDEHKRRPKREDERRRHEEREREASGDDPKRHAGIIARRWLGSPGPTAERYALAHRQWQNLPGSVSKSAPDVAGPTAAPAAQDAGSGPTHSADEVSES